MKRSIGFAALGLMATLVIPGAVQAQVGWQSMTGGTLPFWANTSDDQQQGGPACHIGAVLTNPALAGAMCMNQNPADLLPLSGKLAQTPTQYLGNGANPAAFAFGAGTYRVDYLGSIAGSNPTRPWYIRDALTGADLIVTPGVGGSAVVYAPNGFYIAMDAWSPAGNIYKSNTMYEGTSQFAVFTKNAKPPQMANGVAILDGSVSGTEYYVGMEDNACNLLDVANGACTAPGGARSSRVSDRDYNDMVVRITAVPEPSTYLLMSIGLGAMGVMSRRRRKA